MTYVSKGRSSPASFSREKHTTRCGLLDSGLVALLLLFLTLGCSSLNPRKRQPSFDKSPASQAKRKQAIDEMIQRGVFLKVDKTDVAARAFVRPAFYGLSVDQKRDLMNVVYGYYYDDSSSAVLIKDASTGKNVGTYSLTLGLELE